jgi:3-phenylpropionate/cinnamic acid dioxygenase small subunit
MTQPCQCSDRQAVVDVLNRYARCLDNRDWNGLDSVFDLNVTGDYGAVLTGRTTLVEMIRGLLDACGPTQHLLGNYVIDTDGDTARADTQARVIHIGAGERAALTPYESIGTYHDELRRTEDGWRITHRRFAVRISIGDIGILGFDSLG